MDVSKIDQLMLPLVVNLQHPSSYPLIPRCLFLLVTPKQILPMTPTLLPLVDPRHRLNCSNHFNLLQIPPQLLLRHPLQILLHYFLL